MKRNRVCILWYLIFGSVLVLGTLPAHSAEPELSPILNLSPDLVPGLEAFRAKEYDRAYDMLLKAFEEDPGNFLVNFYLGRAAFEAGHYEMAVMVFDRASMLRPQDPRIKLEMARAYQRLGLNDMARQYCREVLLTDPPLVVKENIERFLAFIDKTEQRQFFRGSLRLGAEWVDNVWSSPADTIIETILGSAYLTGPSSGEKDDFIYSVLAELNHTYSFSDSNSAWQTRLTGYRALYHEENDLDTLYIGIESGPERYVGKGAAGLHITADYLDLDGSKYSDAVGAKAFYRHVFNPSLAVSPSLAYQSRSYKFSSARDADNYRFEVETAFLFTTVWCGIVLGYEQRNAKDDEYSYDQYDFQLSVTREFDPGITLYGSYDYSRTTYEGTAYLFDKPRRDHVHSIGFGIKKRFWQSQDRTRSFLVSLGYGYTRADANLELYDYSKNVIQSAVEYRF